METENNDLNHGSVNKSDKRSGPVGNEDAQKDNEYGLYVDEDETNNQNEQSIQQMVELNDNDVLLKKSNISDLVQEPTVSIDDKSLSQGDKEAFKVVDNVLDKMSENIPSSFNTTKKSNDFVSKELDSQSEEETYGTYTYDKRNLQQTTEIVDNGSSLEESGSSEDTHESSASSDSESLNQDYKSTNNEQKDTEQTIKIVENSSQLKEPDPNQTIQDQDDGEEIGSLSFGNTRVINNAVRSPVQDKQKTPDISDGDTQQDTQILKVNAGDDNISKKLSSNENVEIRDIKDFENAVHGYMDSDSTDVNTLKNSILNSINNEKQIIDGFDKIRSETFNREFKKINEITNDDEKISIICSTFNGKAKLEVLKGNLTDLSDSDNKIKNLRKFDKINSIKEFERKNFKSSGTGEEDDHSPYSSIPRMEKCKLKNKILSGKFVYGNGSKSVDMKFKINSTIGNFYVNHAACECSILLNILLEHNGDLSKCGIEIGENKIEKLNDLKKLDDDLFKAFTACENYDKFLSLANDYGFYIENEKTTKVSLSLGKTDKNVNSTSGNNDTEINVLGRDDKLKRQGSHVGRLEDRRSSSSASISGHGL